MCYMHVERLRKYGSTDDPKRPWGDRFWEKVDKSGYCWLWTSATDRRGYGLLGGLAPERPAHRLAMRTVGIDPTGHDVLHRCENPPCVRPAHLYLGDDQANHQDMVDRHRSTWGEKNYHAKLSESDVREIRRRTLAGELQREIAAQFAVSRTTVSDISRRRSWDHLPD